MSSSEKVEAVANLGRTLVCAAAAVGEHQLFDHLLFQKITSTRAPPLLLEITATTFGCFRTAPTK